MRTLRVAVLVCMASRAFADPSDTVALDHLDRGVAAYRLGDYDTAHRELEIAHELAPDKPNPYRWLALTEVKQGNCRDALVHVEAFLSRVPATDARVPEVVAARQECVASSQPTQPPPPPPPPPESHPIYTKWWFWTAVGAVAVAAAGVTFAVTRGGDTILPPIHCNPGGCP